MLRFTHYNKPTDIDKHIAVLSLLGKPLSLVQQTGGPLKQNKKRKKTRNKNERAKPKNGN